MSIQLWTPLWLLLSASIAWAGGPKPAYEMHLNGDIRIGPDGSVQDYHLQTDLSPKVVEIIDRHVRTWKFQPIVVDGKPVAARTSMRIWLSAEPYGDDAYALKLDGIWFGAPERSKNRIKAPKYPRDAVQAHLGAKVMLALKIDAQGNVTDAWAEQVSLDAQAPEGVAERWRRKFEKSSVEAARQWKYAVTESIGDQPSGTIIRTPLFFAVDVGKFPASKPPSDDGTWLAYIPGPVRPNPWETPKSPPTQADFDAMNDGDVQALASRFQLLDDVVGKAL